MIPELRSPTTTTVDRTETTRRDGAIRDLPDNTAAIRAMNLPVEEAPKFDYRGHSKTEAIQHILTDILAYSAISAIGGTSMSILWASIRHHDISKEDILNAASRSAAGHAAMVLIHDAWDTLRANGD